ncbi:MAG: hypothetical protein AAGC57_08855 [Pseudomonadota bacterium]
MQRQGLAGLAAAWFVLASLAPAKADPLFDQPAAMDQFGRVAALLAAGDTDAAERAAALAMDRFPDTGVTHAALALMRAAQQDGPGALQALTDAIRLGFQQGRKMLSLPAFAQLAKTPEHATVLAALAGQPETPDPIGSLADVEALSAPISAENTVWRAREREFQSRIRVPPVLAKRPTVAAGFGLDRIAPFVNRWVAGGRASGLAGVLYDNRDRAHSSLDRRVFPQLLHTAYAEPIRSRSLDYGPNRLFEFGRITFGNSSTAILQGAYWRSQSRRLMTEPGGPERLFRQYSRNMLYVFPEKFDHGEKGADLYPANTPYMLTSVGASGSDRPFLTGIALALAAMQPDLRDRAEEDGLIAPLLQRLIRGSMTGIEDDADYLSPAAHPSVFRGEELELERLVSRAQALSLTDLAPMVRLTLLRRPPLSAFDRIGVVNGEVLFETPSAIALVHRSLANSRRIKLSAGATRDPLGRPVTFRWVVLRGDAERIQITPETDGAAVVTIEVPWHDTRAVPDWPALRSNRVDIAVFADTGESLSAPAFLSISYPPDQARTYAPDGRLMEIDHAADPAIYADPWIHPRRDWRDVFAYDDMGALTGWERHRRGSPSERFDARGRRLEAHGPVEIRYGAGDRGRDGRATVLTEPAN